jgi:hypothetical protein
MTALEQWAYRLLRCQPDLSQAGTLTLAINRWAAECADVDADALRDLLLSLAAKDYIVIDFEHLEVLLCWFITTDNVYKKPHPLTSAATTIENLRSPGIRTALHNELKQLDESGDVPVERVPTIRWLIGELESFALIGTKQPLHNPSTRVTHGVRTTSAEVALAEWTASAGAAQPVPNGSAPVAEPGQSHLILGHNNPCAKVPSITSLQVGGDDLNVKHETETKTSAANAAAPFEHDLSTASGLVALWLERCAQEGRPRPLEQVIKRVGRDLKSALAQGVSPDNVRIGFGYWFQWSLEPSAIISVINEINQNGGHPAPGRPRGQRQYAPGSGPLLAAGAADGKADL